MMSNVKTYDAKYVIFDADQYFFRRVPRSLHVFDTALPGNDCGINNPLSQFWIVLMISMMNENR